MPTETPDKKTKRRRYRTRMFDDRLSFPATSEQVRQLQAESDAEGRSVASLVREAIDQFLPRLRKRLRKHQRTPLEPLAVAPQAHLRLQRTVRRLLGDPQKQEGVRTQTVPPGQTVKWFYGPTGSLEIDLQSGTWYDSEKETRGSVLDLVMREKQLDQAEAIAWVLDKGPGTRPGPATLDG